MRIVPHFHCWADSRLKMVSNVEALQSCWFMSQTCNVLAQHTPQDLPYRTNVGMNPSWAISFWGSPRFWYPFCDSSLSLNRSRVFLQNESSFRGQSRLRYSIEYFWVWDSTVCSLIGLCIDLPPCCAISLLTPRRGIDSFLLEKCSTQLLFAICWKVH